MIKHTYFHEFNGDGWPELKWLEQFFLTRGRTKGGIR
jgi:hypothetical protein